MLNRQRTQNRRLRVVLGTTAVGMVLAGIAVASIGTASAGTAWNLRIDDINVPAGTRSVLVEDAEEGTSRCAGWNGVTEISATDTGVTAIGGRRYNLTPHSDEACTGATTGATITYGFDVNQDVEQVAGECRSVVVGITRAVVGWMDCS